MVKDKGGKELNPNVELHFVGTTSAMICKQIEKDKTLKELGLTTPNNIGFLEEFKILTKDDGFNLCHTANSIDG